MRQVAAIAIVACIVLSVMASAVSAASVVGPEAPETATKLAVVPARYDPYPAESGKNLRIWIKVENKGSSPEVGRFKLEASYPFSLNPGDTGMQDVGTIDVGRQVILEYLIRVDALALTDIYNHSLWLKQCADAACANAVRFPIGIYVRRPNPIIDIASVATSPAEIRAGKAFALNLNLSSGGSRVKDVVVKLDLAGVPFGPYGASTEKRIESIDAGSSVLASFSLIATGSAASGVYKVPISLSYSDEVGNTYTKSDMITLVVGGEPQIELLLSEAKLNGNIATATVSVVNKGLVDVKFLTLRLQPSQRYRLLSASEIYIGDIDSDDYDTAEFKLFLHDGNDSVPLLLQATYMDALNNEFSTASELVFSIESLRIAQQNQNGIPAYLILIFLVIVGYAIYRHKKKR